MSVEPPGTSAEGLPKPPDAATAEQAIEVLRLWFIDGKPAATIWPAFEDPRWLGAIMADLLRDIAKTYEAAGLMSAARAYHALHGGFTSALQSPDYVPGPRIKPIV